MDEPGDVLRPPMVRVGNANYRRTPVLNETQGSRYQDDYIDDDNTYYDQDDDEVCDAKVNLQETAHGYRIDMPEIPTALYGFVIGKRGETLRRIQEETGTQIHIPRAGQDGHLMIKGRGRKGVMSAHTRIELLVGTGRKKHGPTHFLAIPVDSQIICDNLASFKEDVLKTCDDDRGIDSLIFQTPDKLHITFGVMVLLTEAEVQRADQLLQKCQKTIMSILRDKPLDIILEGLDYMNDDPESVRVLYIKSRSDEDGNHNDRLQELANYVMNTFVSDGIMAREYETVKLHVTVMNAKFRKTDEEKAAMAADPRKRWTKAIPFDATGVLNNFQSYDFGVHHATHVHIYRMHSADEHGPYISEAKIPIR